jgi:ABC-type microcin C transport system permease subunit YejE
MKTLIISIVLSLVVYAVGKIITIHYGCDRWFGGYFTGAIVMLTSNLVTILTRKP